MPTLRLPRIRTSTGFTRVLKNALAVLLSSLRIKINNIHIDDGALGEELTGNSLQVKINGRNMKQQQLLSTPQLPRLLLACQAPWTIPWREEFSPEVVECMPTSNMDKHLKGTGPSIQKNDQYWWTSRRWNHNCHSLPHGIFFCQKWVDLYFICLFTFWLFDHCHDSAKIWENRKYSHTEILVSPNWSLVSFFIF